MTNFVLVRSRPQVLLVIVPCDRADVPGITDTIDRACAAEGYELFATGILGVSPPWFLIEMIHCADQVVMYDAANGELAMTSARTVLLTLTRAVN